MSEQTAPAPAKAPADKKTVLRGILGRIASGEFDPGHKDFHRFVVKEIYPLLGDATLTVEDLERITKAYSARADPYNAGNSIVNVLPDSSTLLA
jgi:hypothetical protein